MKNKLAKLSSKIGASAVVLSGLATTTFAQSFKVIGLENIDGTGKDLDAWIIGLINWAIGIAALAAVVMLIASGYMYITANGDEGKVEKATKTLTFAIIGLIVCFIAVMLVRFVLTSFLGQ